MSLLIFICHTAYFSKNESSLPYLLQESLVIDNQKGLVLRWSYLLWEHCQDFTYNKSLHQTEGDSWKLPLGCSGMQYAQLESVPFW